MVIKGGYVQYAHFERVAFLYLQSEIYVR
jgi:hypothetical protein